MATLEVCVKQILCGLSSSVLRSLQTIIDGQIAFLQTQITTFQTQLLQYDVLSIPLQAANTVTQTIVDETKRYANLIPLNVISECVDLGDFNLNLNQSLDLFSNYSNELTYEATRLLSYREELNEIIDKLNVTINQFTDIRSIIDQCLTGT